LERMGDEKLVKKTVKCPESGQTRRRGRSGMQWQDCIEMSRKGGRRMENISKRYQALEIVDRECSERKVREKTQRKR